MLVLQLAEHVFVGQSTIGISLFKLETPYADPHVRCCERCDAKTSAYSIAPTLEFFLLTIAHFLPSLFSDAVSSCHLLHLQAYRIISLKLYYLRKIFYICCLTAVFSLLKTVTFCVGSILCYDALSWLKMQGLRTNRIVRGCNFAVLDNSIDRKLRIIAQFQHQPAHRNLLAFL